MITLVFWFLCLTLILCWVSLHLHIRNRFVTLSAALPDAYLKAAWARPDDEKAQHLIPLSIDLMRKKRCTLSYDALTSREQRIALHAFAVEELPLWQAAYAGVWLRGHERELARQLRNIKSSQPQHQVTHFGAIRAQQRLRIVSGS